MLSEFFSNLLQGISDFFVWLWGKISSFFVYLWQTVWNYIIDLFWDLYADVVDWFASTIASLLPSDTLDFQDQVNYITNTIAGWDQILPVHESFLCLSFLVSYHLIKLAVAYGVFAISMIRKFLPF